MSKPPVQVPWPKNRPLPTNTPKPLANPGPVSQKCTQTTLAVLQNPALFQVNFEYHNLLVTGVRYQYVRQAILDGKITCHVGVGQDGLEVGTKALAKYIGNVGNSENLPPNEIRFPSDDYGLQNDEQKCVIVHEATHAMFDILMKGQSALGSDNECAAYLAAALFSKRARFEMPRASYIINGTGDNALKLAAKIISRLKGNETYRVSDDEIADLKESVSYDYKFLKTPDGDRTNERDIFDGV